MLLPGVLVRSGWDRLLLLLPFSTSPVFSMGGVFEFCAVCSPVSFPSGFETVSSDSLSGWAPSGGSGGLALWLWSSLDICSGPRCQVTRNYPAMVARNQCCFSDASFNARAKQTFKCPVQRGKSPFFLFMYLSLSLQLLNFLYLHQR